jgi:hypothetical protein
VSRHECICLSFQHSVSGLEYQPLLLEHLWSSCFFLFHHSAQSLRDTSFSWWFVVTIGLGWGDQLKMSRFCSPIVESPWLVGGQESTNEHRLQNLSIFLKNLQITYCKSQNATSYAILQAFPKIAFSIVSAKRDALRDASSICNTRITCVALMDRFNGITQRSHDPRII